MDIASVNLLLLVILFVAVLNLALAVYNVAHTVDVARDLAAGVERARAELIAHMRAKRAVSVEAADAAKEAQNVSNHVNTKLERIAGRVQSESRAEDEARAVQLQRIATTGEDTHRDVKEVKDAVVNRGPE